MHIIDTLFFYSLSCSIVLVYGFGLEKSLGESGKGLAFFKHIPGLFLDGLLAVTVLWYPVSGLLLPYNFVYLVPMVIILVSLIIHSLMTILFPFLDSTYPGEKIFFFGTVFLALSESVSFADSLIILTAGFVAFSLLTVVLFSIRERIATANVHTDWKGTPLVLISMGLLCIVLYSSDVSWWLSEVFR